MQFINNDKTNHPIKNNFAIERYMICQSNVNMHISGIYKYLYINRSMMFICVYILAIGCKVFIFLHLHNYQLLWEYIFLRVLACTMEDISD